MHAADKEPVSKRTLRGRPSRRLCRGPRLTALCSTAEPSVAAGRLSKHRSIKERLPLVAPVNTSERLDSSHRLLISMACRARLTGLWGERLGRLAGRRPTRQKPRTNDRPSLRTHHPPQSRTRQPARHLSRDRLSYRVSEEGPGRTQGRSSLFELIRL